MNPCAQTTKKNILVVDDHPLLRKALCDVINARPDLMVGGEAVSLADTRQILRSTRPALMILDLGLPDGNGWVLVEALHAAGQLPPTLVLSAYDENIYVPRLLKLGVRGYLMKDTPIPVVMNAIDRIFAGHIALSDRQTSILIRKATSGDGNPPSPESELHSLSDRELQVLEALGRELNNRQIAESLGVSPKTVATYKARLMEKTGIHTTTELHRHARQYAQP